MTKMASVLIFALVSSVMACNEKNSTVHSTNNNLSTFVPNESMQSQTD